MENEISKIDLLVILWAANTFFLLLLVLMYKIKLFNDNRLEETVSKHEADLFCEIQKSDNEK